MIAEIGHFALILAFAVAVFQTIVPLVGAAKGWTSWMEAGRPAAALQPASPIQENHDMPNTKPCYSLFVNQWITETIS